MKRPIFTVIFLFIAIALALGLVWPKYQNLRSLQINLEEKEKELQSKTEYFSRIKETSAELKNYQDSLSKILTALPSTPSLPSLFYFLQKASAQTGLVLESITVGGIGFAKEESEKELKQIKEIRAHLRVSGSYSAFKDFLSVVEKSARLIEVRTTSFSTPLKPQESFSFELGLRNYSY